MLTAAITAAVAALLGVFGVKASLAQLAVVALVIKLLLVFSGLFIGRKVMKRRQAAEAAAQEQPAEPERP